MRRLGITAEEYDKATDLNELVRTSKERRRRTINSSDDDDSKTTPASTAVRPPVQPEAVVATTTAPSLTQAIAGRTAQALPRAPELLIDSMHYPQIQIDQSLSVPPILIKSVTDDLTPKDVVAVQWKQKYGDEPMFAPSMYEPAPPAVPSKTASQRRDWINLTEKYVLTNFENNIIGDLRYKNKTYAEHCHHLAPDWDTHKFCPDCYKRFGLNVVRILG